MSEPGKATRPPAKKISREDVKYLQRLRHALKVDDDTYAAMKASVGVASTLDLTHAQYNDLVRRIRGELDPDEAALGSGKRSWKPMHKSAAASGMDKEPAEDKKPQLSKIEALLADMKLSWAYADAISNRMYRVRYVRWCSREQLTGIITALVKKQRKLDASAESQT